MHVNPGAAWSPQTLVHTQPVIDTVAVAVDETTGLVYLDAARGARALIDAVMNAVSVNVGPGFLGSRLDGWDRRLHLGLGRAPEMIDLRAQLRVRATVTAVSDAVAVLVASSSGLA